MPNHYPGIRDAVTAFMGGGRTEALSHRDEMDRLTKSRTSQEKLNRAVAEAVKAKEIADSMTNIRQSGQAGPSDIDLILAGLGSSFAGTQLGRGREQQNQARQAMMTQLAEGGELDTDMANLITAIMSGKLLGPTNVQVGEQAQADLEATRALTGQREAAGRYSDARAGITQAGTESEDFLPPGAVMDFIFPYREGEPDPKFAEFSEWRARQAQIDPSYNNFNKAYNAFLTGTEATPPAKTTEPQMGDTHEPVLADRTGTEAAAPTPQAVNYADADAIIAGANRALQAGKDPAQVTAIMKRELMKLGIPEQQIDAMLNQ